MRTPLLVVALTLLVFTVTAPSASASTSYNLFGHELEYSEWGQSPMGTMLRLTPAGEPAGFDVQSYTVEAGGSLNMGMQRDMDFRAQIDFRDLYNMDGRFGLSLGWNNGGANEGVGIFIGHDSSLGNGVAAMQFNDAGGATPVGTPVFDMVNFGSLVLEKTGTQLTASWANTGVPGAALNQLHVFDLAALGFTADNMLFSLSASIGEEWGMSSVWFTEFTLDTTATPIPGAVWLLGSGLAGLVGLRRKFSK